jgi:hypothetical protein
MFGGGDASLRLVNPISADSVNHAPIGLAKSFVGCLPAIKTVAKLILQCLRLGRSFLVMSLTSNEPLWRQSGMGQ